MGEIRATRRLGDQLGPPALQLVGAAFLACTLLSWGHPAAVAVALTCLILLWWSTRRRLKWLRWSLFLVCVAASALFLDIGAITQVGPTSIILVPASPLSWVPPTLIGLLYAMAASVLGFAPSVSRHFRSPSNITGTERTPDAPSRGGSGAWFWVMGSSALVTVLAQTILFIYEQETHPQGYGFTPLNIVMRHTVDLLPRMIPFGIGLGIGIAAGKGVSKLAGLNEPTASAVQSGCGIVLGLLFTSFSAGFLAGIGDFGVYTPW